MNTEWWRRSWWRADASGPPDVWVDGIVPAARYATKGITTLAAQASASMVLLITMIMFYASRSLTVTHHAAGRKTRLRWMRGGSSDCDPIAIRPACSDEINAVAGPPWSSAYGTIRWTSRNSPVATEPRPLRVLRKAVGIDLDQMVRLQNAFIRCVKGFPHMRLHAKHHDRFVFSASHCGMVPFIELWECDMALRARLASHQL